MPQYPAHIPEPLSLTQQLGDSAIQGAAAALLPEVVGDAGRLLGFVDHTVLEELKSIINFILLAGMLGLADSPLKTTELLFLGLLASTLVKKGLKAVGVDDAPADLLSQGAALVVSTYKDTNPATLAASAVGFAAAKFGLWAEKRIVRQLELVPILNQDAGILRI